MIGLVLAVLGLTGMLLVFKEDWVLLPHAGDPLIRDAGVVGETTARLIGDGKGVQSIVYASERFGLHQLRRGEGAGAYADQAGTIVTQWNSQWERPEIWLFDLHHHLFTGDFGETIIGIAGLCGLGFVITGVILWWRLRKTFSFRLWPKRMSRPMIVLHHRNLGVIAAPLLFLSTLTGAMMVFKWFSAAVLAPISSPAAVAKSMAAPKVKSGPLAAHPDWQAMIVTAHQTFPDAEIRILALPRKAGDPITIRMKRAAEWLPNGRSTLWFDAGTGRLLASRDALAMPAGAQVFNAAYPLHAAKVGGIAYRLVMAFSGFAMALLGSLAVWTFWFKRPKPRRT